MPWPDVRDAHGVRRPVPVELAQTGDREFTLRAPLLYVDADGTRRTVPAGFTTDLASVPFPLWSVIGPFGRQTRAAILHDHEVLQTVGASRSRARRAHVADADRRFRRALRESGVPPLRAELMWAAVTIARVVKHHPVPAAVALPVQLALGVVCVVAALTPALHGPAALVAALLPAVLAALWGRLAHPVVLIQYVGLLAVPVAVVNVAVSVLLGLGDAVVGGRARLDLLPTRRRARDATGSTAGPDGAVRPTRGRPPGSSRPGDGGPATG